MSDECVFCRIAAGKLPCAKVYEDSDVLAFMDIAPVAKGHTLVVPKAHFPALPETPPETLQKLIIAVQRIARAQREGLAADGINVAQANGRAAGQEVAHIHFHVIPRFAADSLPSNWKPGRYDNSGQMDEYATRIRRALAR